MSSNDQITFREGSTERQKRMLALLDELNKLEPNLMERLCPNKSNSTAATRDARTRLNTSQSNGKSEDMWKVKEAIASWRAWNPPLAPSDDTSSCGLNHGECAFFLSAQLVNWEDENARNEFISNGNPAMTPGRWPRFLWLEGAYNPVRHSLTSNDVFSNVCAGYSYIEFYDQLISWWNDQLFLTYQSDLHLGAINSPGDGTLADLDAEIEGDGPEDETQVELDIIYKTSLPISGKEVSHVLLF